MDHNVQQLELLSIIGRTDATLENILAFVHQRING